MSCMSIMDNPYLGPTCLLRSLGLPIIFPLSIHINKVKKKKKEFGEVKPQKRYGIEGSPKSTSRKLKSLKMIRGSHFLC